MEFWIFGGVLFTVVISVLIGLPKARQSSRSLTKFYLNDGKLGSWSISHLLGASSMSLNGLFYHTYLGYQVGVYSLLIQAVWAASFLLFIWKIDKFLELANSGSLFGNIDRFYGRATSKISALAVSFTMLALLGWEISIAGTLSQDLFQFNNTDALIAVFGLVAIAAMYTLRGGIHANMRANEFQNWAGFICFLLIGAGAVFVMFDPLPYLSGLGQETPNTVKGILKLNPAEAAIALGGGAALMCNLFFSFFWQQAEATTWQTVTAGLDNGTSDKVKASKSIRRSAIKVFILPGFAGTLLGMTLSGVPNLTDANIMPAMFSVFDSFQHGNWIALLFAILLSAAMLSTLDGLFLGVSYTLNRDVINTKHFKKLILIENDECKSDEHITQERKIISVGKLLVLAAAALSVFMFLLVQNEKLDLFQAVYFAVTAQMAVTPLIIRLLWKKPSTEPRQKKWAWLSILAGLIAGFFCIGMFISGNENAFVSSIPWIGSVLFIYIAPPVAFMATAIVLKALPTEPISTSE